MKYFARQVRNFEMLQLDCSVLVGLFYFFQFNSLDIMRIGEGATDRQNAMSFLMQKV